MNFSNKSKQHWISLVAESASRNITRVPVDDWNCKPMKELRKIPVDCSACTTSRRGDHLIHRNQQTEGTLLAGVNHRRWRRAMRHKLVTKNPVARRSPCFTKAANMEKIMQPLVSVHPILAEAVDEGISAEEFTLFTKGLNGLVHDGQKNTKTGWYFRRSVETCM